MRTLFALLAVTPIWGAFHVEPNQGQFAEEVRYGARLRHGSVQWTDRATIFTRGAVAVRVELSGASAQAEWQPRHPKEKTTTYLIGRDPAGWRHRVPQYAALERLQVYPGIDWIAYGAGQTMEYDFVVAPHADPRQIRLRFTGAEALRVNRRGDLEIATPNGPLVQRAPVLYQKAGNRREPVAGRFRVQGHEVSFVIGTYDRSRTLWIDPELDAATFWGGSAEDDVIYANPEGYVVGTTSSVDLPNSASRRRGRDVFVQIPFEGTVVFGGSGDDIATGAAVNAQQPGTLHVGGYTNSPDLPTTNGVRGPNSSALTSGFALQPAYAGGASDGFMVTFSRQNASFVRTPLTPFMATYFGSPGEDRVLGLWASPAGGTSLAVTGYSDSAGLPGRLGPNSAHRGGKDAFFSVLDINFGNASTLYLGGAGDDEGRAITIYGASKYLIGGETRSADFPGASGLKGDSDAFVLGTKTVLPGGVAEVDRSVVFGGAGVDRVNALTNNPFVGRPIFAAGVTSSPDFPQSAGRAYAGGGTDAFVQRWPWETLPAEPEWATLLGGGGSDEALAVSYSWGSGSVAVAGRTDSPSLPVVDPSQPAYGGGASDGWVARYRAPDQEISLLTYVGGPGEDRINWVDQDSHGGALLLAGSSEGGLTSRFPGTAHGGGSDGFTARLLSREILGLSPQLLPQDVQRPVNFRIAGDDPGGETLLRVRSADPARVLLSTRNTELGTSEVTVSGAGSFSSIVWVQALAGEGAVDLIVTGEGVPERRFRFDLQPLQLRLSPGATAARQMLFNANVTPVTASIAGASFEDTVRPGAAPLRIRAESSRTEIFTPSQPDIVVASPDGRGGGIGLLSFLRFNLRATGVGDGELTVRITDRPEVVPVSQAVSVVSAFGSEFLGSPVLLPTGSQVGVSLPAAANGTSYTLTSSDPSRLLLSRSNTERGSASIALSVGGGVQSPVYLQALEGTGDVTVVARIDDAVDDRFPVRIIPPTVRLQAGQQRGNSLRLNTEGETILAEAGTSVSMTGGFVWNTPGFNPAGFSRTPGFAPLVVPLVSSNPEVAQVQPASLELPAAGAPARAQNVSLPNSGTATITARPPAGVEVDPAFDTLRLRVETPRFSVRNFELGNGLIETIRVALPAVLRRSGTSFTVESSDPDAMDCVTTGGFTGSTTVTTNPFNTDESVFRVRGKRSGGEVTLTLSALGVTTTQVKVTLRPAGFVWETDRRTVALHSTLSSIDRTFLYSPGVRAMALDPETRLPVAEQQSATTFTVPVASSNPGVGALNNMGVPSFVGSSAGSGVSFIPQSVGETTLTLSPPDGYLAPAVQQELRIRVEEGAFTEVYSLILGRSLQTQLTFRTPFARGVNEPITVTSSDPERLLVSDSATRPGSGSVTLTRDSSGEYPGLFLQALAGDGKPTVTLRAAGLKDAVSTVHLRPLAVRFTPPYSSESGFIFLGNGWELLTSGRSPQIGVELAPAGLTAQDDVSRRYTLRAGAAPLDLSVASAQPDLLSIADPRVRFLPGDSSQRLTLQPRAPGQVELRANDSNVTVGVFPLRVRQPRFIAKPILLGRDFQLAYTPGAPSTTDPSPPPTTRITVRSNDTGLLLVSSSAQTVGEAAASTTSGQPVTLQALGEGETSVVVSASGYEDTLVPVRIVRGGLRMMIIQPRFQLQPGQRTAQVSVRVDLDVTRADTLEFQIGPTSVRVGREAVAVTVRSSNPAVASDASAMLLPGQTQVNVDVPITGSGEATLQLVATADFGLLNPSSVVVIATSERPEVFAPNALGRDFVAEARVRPRAGFAPGVRVTVTSSDPARLLVSASATVPGQPSITVPASGDAVFAVHALSDNGTVGLTIRADGFEEFVHRITLRPSAPVFGQTQLALTANGVPASVNFSLRDLNPSTQTPENEGRLRPGVDYLVRLTSTNPGVAAVSPETVRLDVNNSRGTQTLTVRGLMPGSALLRIAGPAGSGTPGTGSSLLIAVDPAPVQAPPAMLLGRDLQSRFRVQLTAAPASTVTFSLSTSDPSRLVLSLNPNTLGSSSLVVAIGAGQRESQPIYVQAIGGAAAANAPMLQVSGVSSTLGRWTMPVTLRDPVVGFASVSQPLVVRRAGNTVWLRVSLSVSAQAGDPLPGQLLVRPGAGRSFSVRSTNNSVLAIGTITSNALPASEGDAPPEVSLIPVAVGTARIEVTAVGFGSGAASQVGVQVE